MIASATAPRFRIGDPVQLVVPFAGLAAGTMGTVVGRLDGSPLCGVQFSGAVGTRLVDWRKLVPVPPDPSRCKSP
jgi:hypothetical protein